MFEFEVLKEIVLRAVTESELFAGGLVLGIMGAIGGIVYKIVPPMKEFIRRRMTISMDIRDQDAFVALERWLHKTQYAKECRKLQVSSSWKKNVLTFLFTPGRGNHFFRHDKHWYWLERGLEDSDVTSLGRRSDSHAQKQETFTIRSYGRDVSRLKAIMVESEVLANEDKEQGVATFFLNSWGDWRSGGLTARRKLETVILPEGIKEELVTDIKEFLSAQGWYTDMGIPYRRGYLLHGPPGSGKSSLVKALASSLDMPLYVATLSSKGLSDESLISSLSHVERGSMILFEDIDAVHVGTRESKEGDDRVSLSGLLNALDGVVAQEGSLVFLTTNFVEKLDAALVREGRVDLKLHLENADDWQAEELFLRFFPEVSKEIVEEFVSWAGGKRHSMAFLQGHLLKYRDDLDTATRGYEETTKGEGD